jgi:hypothetical protein
VRPFSELLRRVHRLLVLLVVARHSHSCAVAFKRVRRHALIHILVRHLDFAGELNVVVSELSNFNIVNTSGLLFLSGTEAESGDETPDEIESAKDDTRAEEGVGATGEGVGELVPDLDPVAVEPAARNDRVAVEMRNVVTARESDTNR